MSKLNSSCLIVIFLTLFVTTAISKVQSRHHWLSQQQTPAGLAIDEWDNIKEVILANKFANDGQSYLKASNIGAENEFGFSVAISGNTLVVGAPGEDNGSGAAYVFVRGADNSWNEEKRLEASNRDFEDWFGYSVAIDGNTNDGYTIVVGARNESSNDLSNPANNSAANSGAAYVFIGNGAEWTQSAYLKASDKTSNIDSYDRFGSSVGISGNTIVVGADGEDSDVVGVSHTVVGDSGDDFNNFKSSSGAAYVFKHDGQDWNQQAYLKASNTDAGDNFGWAVAISGERIVVSAVSESSSSLNVDNAVIVGQEDNSAPFSGAVYVFERVEESWIQDVYLKPTNTEEFDFFGTSVSISGETLVIGAEGEDSRKKGVTIMGDGFTTGLMSDAGTIYEFTDFDSGAVYVFTHRINSSWTQRAYIKASIPSEGASFGYSVSIAGNRLAIGADSQASEGAAYVFTRSNNVEQASMWSQVKDVNGDGIVFKGSNTTGFDEFGASVAISPESPESSESSSELVVVGAIGEDSGFESDETDNSASRSGAVYVFVDQGVIFKNGFE